MPGLDFQTFYGPGNLWTLAVLYGLTEPSVYVERAAGFGYRALAILALYAVVARRCRVSALAGAFLTGGLLVYPPVTLMATAWSGALALILLALERVDRGDGLGAGVSTALALTFRPDALLLALALAPGTRRLPAGPRRTAVLAMGFGLVPLLAHVAMASPSAVYENLIVDAVIRTRAGRSLPLAALGADGLVILTLAGAGSAVVLLQALVRRGPDSAIRVSAGLVGLLALLQVFQRADALHLVTGALPGLALLPFAFGGWGGRVWRVASIASLAVPVLLAPEFARAAADSWIAALLARPQPSFVLVHRGREIPFDSPEARADVAGGVVLVEACSSPGDRLFVGPSDLATAFMNDTFFYHLFPQLRPATYFLEMNPGSANREGSRLAADIVSADVVLLTARFEGYAEENASTRRESRLPALLLEKYFQRAGRRGSFEVWRRRSPAPEVPR